MSKHDKHSLAPGPGGMNSDSCRSNRGIDRLGNSPLARIPRPILWIGVLLCLVAWSSVATLLYVLVDPVLNWLAAASGTVLDSGKGLMAAAGVDKQISGIVEKLDPGSLSGQIFLLLKIVAKPAIIAILAFVAVLIVLMPIMVTRIGKLISSRH